MVDWIAVLKGVEARTLCIDDDGDDSVASVVRAVNLVTNLVLDELERQRDAAQEAMQGSASDIGSASSPETPRPPASICDQYIHHDSLKDGRCELPAGHAGWCSNKAFPYQPVMAQGAGEEGLDYARRFVHTNRPPTTAAPTAAAAADRSASSPAPSERRELQEQLRTAYNASESTGWGGVVHYVLAREADLRTQLAEAKASKREEADAILDANSLEECARLRAQLAEAKAEPEALRSSERERLIREACEAWDWGHPITDAMTRLTNYERARRAKEKP